MTEYELNEFQSEFDPVAFSQSMQEDPAPHNRARNFALLKTAQDFGQVLLLLRVLGAIVFQLFQNVHVPSSEVKMKRLGSV